MPATPPPTVLASTSAAELNGATLAVDSTFLYFTTTSTVQRIALAGGLPLTVATNMHGPIVLDANNVYGFDATGIVSAPKSGGAPASASKGSALGQHLAVDATNLYFHSYYGVRTNGDNYHQSIYSLQLATGTVLNIATNQFVTSPFASDAANLYWFSDNDSFGVKLFSMPKSGAAPTMLASGGGPPDGPAFDGTSLYWTTSGGWSAPLPPSTVSSLASAGSGTPAVLATALDTPGDLAVDADNVYFTLHYDRIMKLPKSGGTPTTLATQLMRPTSLVLDDTSVYFIDAGAGNIDKISK